MTKQEHLSQLNLRYSDILFSTEGFFGIENSARCKEVFAKTCLL